MESGQRYYQKNKERLQKASRECRMRRRAEDPAKYMLDNAQDRARIKGLEFALSREWLEVKLVAGVCEVTGVKLDWSRETTKPSLDRLDTSKGYTEKNTRVTTWIYNRARGTFSDEEFMEYLVRPFRTEA